MKQDTQNRAKTSSNDGSLRITSIETSGYVTEELLSGGGAVRRRSDGAGDASIRGCSNAAMTTGRAGAEVILVRAGKAVLSKNGDRNQVIVEGKCGEDEYVIYTRNRR